MVRRHCPLAIVLAVLLAATACTATSSDDGGAASPDPASVDGDDRDDGRDLDTEASGNRETNANRGTEGSGDEGHDDDQDEDASVLGRHLGYEIPGLDVGDETELRRIEQETLADCMAGEGFTYIAYMPDPAALYVPVEEGLDPESREFAARYGFGVSTQFYAQRDVGPGLLGHSGDGSGYAFEENPNDVIRAELSPEELDAYERAFWGAGSPRFMSSAEQAELEAEGVLVGRLLASHGCFGEAQQAIDGEAFEVLDVFAIEILTMTERAYSDERYLTYAASVERCVHEAGYDFYANQPAWTTLAHFDGLLTEVDAIVGGDPFEDLTDAELAALSPREIDELFDTPRDVPDEARDQLAEIQDLEVATATTVWDCGGSADEERRVIGEVLSEMQAEFIETNRDELERFRR